MKRYFRVLTASAVLIPVIAQATPNNIPEGYITWMSGGWVGAHLRVRTDAAFANPDNCTYTDGYVTEPADSGSVLFNSMLLSAYMSRRKISLTIDGCTLQRPRIIGVIVLPD